MLAFLNDMGNRIREGWANFLRSLGNRFWSLISWLREGVFGRQRQGGYTPAQASSDASMVTSKGEILEGNSSIDSTGLENNPNAESSSAIVLLEESSSHSIDDLSLQKATLTLEEEALLKKAQDALRFLRWTEVYEHHILYLEELFEQGKLTQEQVNERFKDAYKQSAKNEQNIMPAGSISVVESLHMELLGDKTMTYALYKEDLPLFKKKLQPLLKDYHPDNNSLPTGIEHIGQGEQAISIKRLQCRLTLVWIFIVGKIFSMYEKMEHNAQENERWEKIAKDARAGRIKGETQAKEAKEKLEEITNTHATVKAETERLRRLFGNAGNTEEKETTRSFLATMFHWPSSTRSKSAATLPETGRTLSTESSEKLKVNRNGETDEDIGSSFRRSNTT